MMMGTSRQTFQTPWQARMVPRHSRADVRQTASLKEELYWYRLRAWVAPAGHGSGGQREPAAIEQADISGPTEGFVATGYQFVAAYSPTNVHTPVSYSWSPEPTAGQGTSAATYQWASAGSQQVQVTITDGQGNQAQASHSIAIAVPLNSVTISGDTTGNTNTEYQFSATIDPTDATTPLSYSWLLEPKAGQGTSAATYEWANQGLQTISVTVSNVAGSVQDSHQIDINAASSLLTSLVAYWKLDETSGTRFDSAGASNLADNGSVGSAIGKQGNAADFTAGPYLSSSHTGFHFGDEDFTIAGWIKRNASNFVALGRYSTTGQKCYGLRIVNGLARWYVTSNGSTEVFVEASNALNFQGWSLVVCWHDSTSNTIYIQVDNNTTFSQTHTTGVFPGTVDLTIGAGTGGNLAATAQIDEIGIWSRVLTSAERTQLYNGGAATTYPF